METQYVKQYSPALDRDMECKIYGRAGRPVLYIPCQDGRFFDFENFRLTDTWAPWIESGKAMVFSIDTMDKETWSAQGDPGWRVRRHEQWMRYITDEMVPFMRAEANSRNGWTGEPGVMAFGSLRNDSMPARCRDRKARGVFPKGAHASRKPSCTAHRRECPENAGLCFLHRRRWYRMPKATRLIWPRKSRYRKARHTAPACSLTKPVRKGPGRPP